MLYDSVVEEVRAVREAYAKRFNYDIGMICRDLREFEKKSGLKLVTLPPRRIRPDELSAPTRPQDTSATEG